MGRVQQIVLVVSLLSLLVIGFAFAASSIIKPNQSTPIKNVLPAKASKIDLPNNYTVAGWLWESPTVLQPNVSGIVNQAAQEDINTLYLYIDEYVDIYEMEDSDTKEASLQNYTHAVKTIISEANQKGIKIHALSGDTTYGYDSHSYITEIVLNYVFEFNQANPDTKFEGLQFDIEFYEDGRFFGSTEEYTDYYLDLVDSLSVKTAELNQKTDQNLSLGFVIPFWFDRPNEYFSNPILPDIIQSLSQLENSYLVIMAYRNIVDGEGSVMEVAKDELEATENSPVKIVIAQELVQNSDQKITHFGKSRDEIRMDFAKIIDQANNYSSFDGISIHDLPAYLETR